jgi:hypothetical protein
MTARDVPATELPRERHKDQIYWSTVRTVDGPRQRTLCYLGELNGSAQARRLTTEQKSLLHQLGLSRLCTLQREFCSRCNVKLQHPLEFNGISRAKPLAS